MSASPSLRSAPKRAHWRLAALLTLGCVVLALGHFAFARLGGPRANAGAERAGAARVVSLAPAITETLFAIGAGDQVVGVSNYCHFPKDVERLPRTGSAITP